MRHRSLLILFSVIVVDLIGFGIVMPILPFYAAQYGASATVLGLLLTVYSIMQFCFAPVWGRLSDRIGRQRVLVVTLLAGGGSLVILGCAHSLLWVFIGRMLSGIFAANISVATAYVTDVTDESNRARGMGLVGAAFGVGFLLGPLIGGLLAPHGYHVPILVAAGLTIVNGVSAAWRLPEPERHVTAAPDAPMSTDRDAAGPTRRLVVMNFFYTAGLALLETTLAFFLRDGFRYDAHHVAYVLVMMAGIMVVIQGGLIRMLTKRYGERVLLGISTFFLAIALCGMPVVPGIAWLLILLAMSAAARGISQPALFSLVSQSAAAHQRGRVMGVFQSAASLARVVAPALGGFLYDWVPSTVFVLAGTCIIVVFWLGLPLIRYQVPHETQPST